MMYDAIVTTTEGKHTYQNITAVNEQHLINKIAKDLQIELAEIEIKMAKELKTELIEIEIKKTFGDVGNYESYL